MLTTPLLLSAGPATLPFRFRMTHFSASLKIVYSKSYVAVDPRKYLVYLTHSPQVCLPSKLWCKCNVDMLPILKFGVIYRIVLSTLLLLLALPVWIMTGFVSYTTPAKSIAKTNMCSTRSQSGLNSSGEHQRCLSQLQQQQRRPVRVVVNKAATHACHHIGMCCLPRLGLIWLAHGPCAVISSVAHCLQQTRAKPITLQVKMSETFDMSENFELVVEW